MTSRRRRANWSRRSTPAVVLAALALLGCSTQDEPEPQPPVEDDDGAEDDGTEDDDEDDGARDGEASDDETAAGDSEDPEPIADGGDTDPDEAEGESGGLDDDGDLRPQAVTDVRVGSHEGFDRVVFELRSDGATPGWFVEYDEPTEQGSGNEIEVAGDATLNVLINPVTLPPDLPDDVQTFEGDLDGVEGGIVQQIVSGSVYEGYHQFFIGTDRQRPFAVERLDDPPRVVIDLFRETS